MVATAIFIAAKFYFSTRKTKQPGRTKGDPSMPDKTKTRENNDHQYN